MSAGSVIVFIGSMSAVSKTPGSSIYVAAKSGIKGFVPSFRKELAEQDRMVGLIETGFTVAHFHSPEFPHENHRELIIADKFLRDQDRKSVAKGSSVAEGVNHGGRRKLK